MADWKILLKKILLEDGTLDAKKTKILRKEIYAFEIVDESEADFLIDLRQSARTLSPEFEEFFFEALKKNFLADGVIDASEARKLRKIYPPGKALNEHERQFLISLKKEARKVSAGFDNLFLEFLKGN